MRNQSVQSSGSQINILKSISIALLVLTGTLIYGQDRKELESQRTKLIADIENTQNNLRETAQTKNQRLQELNDLENKISKRQQLLSNISSSLDLVEKEKARNDSTLNSLAKNIVEIRD